MARRKRMDFMSESLFFGGEGEWFLLVCSRMNLYHNDYRTTERSRLDMCARTQATKCGSRQKIMCIICTFCLMRSIFVTHLEDLALASRVVTMHSPNLPDDPHYHANFVSCSLQLNPQRWASAALCKAYGYCGRKCWLSLLVTSNELSTCRRIHLGIQDPCIF